MKNCLPKTLCALSSLMSLTAMAQTVQQRPNLVFIMADQYRAQAMGCMGVEPVLTPNLDALASQGVLFTNAVSSYPVSSPARGMLMSGMYPTSSKVTGNCNSDNTPYGVELPTDTRCWSDVLKDEGYRMGYIGKWHLDAPRKPYVNTYNNSWKTAWNEWCPPERRHGFDYWIAYGTYDYHLRPMYWNATAPRDSFYYVDQWGPAYEADRAIEFIQAKSADEQPFALVVSMNPPHTGYELVPQEYKDIYKDLDVEALCADRPDIPTRGTTNGDYYRRSLRDYYACITGVDQHVGRIVECLKKNGLFENTIVVFTSDHGICMGAHEVQGKDVFYDEAMRIPMIISWPQTLAPRRDDRLMPAFADLGPTLLAMMGLRKEIPDAMQTFDLSRQMITGKGKSPIQPYYYITPSDSLTGYRGWRTPTHTFAIHASKGKVDEVVLFDRTADPYQMKNIAKENPKLVKKLTNQLKDWLKKTNDPFQVIL